MSLCISATRIAHTGRILALFILAIITIFSFPQNAGGTEGDLPFRPGEKLTFKLKWSFIPAGKAVLEVLPIETVEGIKAYHFVMTARSNSFVDNFYKVRDRIDAYTDIKMTHTILYKKSQHEGRTRRNVTVNFDWDKNQAQYFTLKDKHDPISILPGSFDPLSIFYRTRLFNLKEKSEIEHPVTDGKKSVIGYAKIVKREKIKVANRTYDTYLLVPDLKHVGGVFKKSKNARIKLWVTADERKIPVKIKSKVVVGSFVGELVSAEGI